MRVADYMSAKVHSLGPDKTLMDAVSFLREKHIRHLPIVADGRLIGIITDRDVKRATPSLLDASVTRDKYIQVLQNTPLRKVMVDQPLCLAPDADLREAVAVMQDQQISGLPIVDGTRLVGILTHTDLLRAFSELLDKQG